MENVLQIRADHTVEFTKYRAHYLQFEDLHRELGEDRIYAGVVRNSYPLIIVADGVSEQTDPITRKIVTGLGGPAAEEVVRAAQEYLKRELSVESVEGILRCLRAMYDSIVQTLKDKNLDGSATLLVVFLWESKDRDLFWCYAYVGNGFINLLSPTREIETIVLPEKLLSPQQVEGTAAIWRGGIPVSPAVGCRLYEPNDLIYVASDGLTPVDSWLRKVHGMSLPYFILSNLREPERMKRVLSECPNYSDDAVLGIIWTEERK